MANRIQYRRDTAANWTAANPTLALGEPGYETDTKRRKIGDGTTAWVSIGYQFDKGGADGYYVPLSSKGVALGVASLDASGKVPSAQIPGGASGGAWVAAASNGTDDTTTLNTLLSSGAVYVQGLPGQTYLISTPLVIPSGVTLDMSGCTVQLKAGSNCQMITNSAVTAARSVMDGVTTAASTTLTSATASFVSGDVGATLWIYDADTDGRILRTTIASVTNSTTVVLTAAPAVTLAAANVSIGPRDSDITIINGTWDRQANNGGSAPGSGKTMFFRRADNLTIRGVRIISTLGITGNLKYAINPGDCTDILIENIRFNYSSDGVHLNGPIRRGTVRTVRGYTRDDSVSLTPNDWTGNNDVWGDITDVLIEDVKTWKSDNTAVKVLGGSASPATASRRITVKDVGGYATNVDQPGMPGLVFIGDDTGQANTTGGLLEDIVVQNVFGKVPNNSPLIGVQAKFLNRLNINGADYTNAAGTQSVIYLSPPSSSTWGEVVIENIRLGALPAGVPPIFVAASANIPSLIIDKVVVATWVGSTSSSAVVGIQGSVTALRISRVSILSCSGGAILRYTYNGTAGTIAELFIDHVSVMADGTTSNYVIYAAASMTITKAVVSNVATSNVGGYAVNIANTTAIIGQVSLRDVHWNGGGGFISTVAGGSTSLPLVQLSNCTAAGSTWGLGDIATTTTVYADNVNATPSANIVNLRATAIAVIYAQNCNFNGKTIQGNAGYTVASKTLGFPIDISMLNSKTKGDAAYNTNASLSCGAGQVVYTGTAWKSLIDGTTY